MLLRELFQEGSKSIRNGREGTVDPALQAKCEAIQEKLASVCEDPAQQKIIRACLINLSWNETDRIYSNPSRQVVTIDQEEFADAPTAVLVWLIAHELGHIVFDHGEAAQGADSQNQELAADAFASRLCVKIGFTKAPVWTWLGRKKNELGRTELERQQALEREPKNADYFKNQSHPTIDNRIKSAGELGMELSKINTDQIDWLMTHTA
jgi:predicted Zn-dependent protease